MTSRPVPIFDGHNDVLLRLYRKEDAAKAFMEGDGKGQLDFPRAREGGFAGGHVRDLRAVAATPARAERAAAAFGRCACGRRRKGPDAAAAGHQRRPAGDAENGVAAVCDRARVRRQGARLPHGRGHRGLHRRRRARAGAAHRGRRGDRREFQCARRAASGGPALARAGVEPVEHLWARRAVQLSVVAGHRAGPDRSSARS